MLFKLPVISVFQKSGLRNSCLFLFSIIVYEGIRRPSTFSNDISSEAVKPILFIFHI